MFHIYNIGGNNRELDIRKNIEPAYTGVPVFPPAGGLPVIKYNTPGQNVSFFAPFSTLFSGRRISISVMGAGLFRNSPERVSRERECRQKAAQSLVSPTEESFQPDNTFLSAHQKNLFCLTILSCQPIRRIFSA